MMRRNDPRIFYGPALPLDGGAVSRPDVTFAAAATEHEQARLLAMMRGRSPAPQAGAAPAVEFGGEGQARDAWGCYRGKELTPEYRRQLLGYSPLGRQILADEDTAALGQADSRR